MRRVTAATVVQYLGFALLLAAIIIGWRHDEPFGIPKVPTYLWPPGIVMLAAGTVARLLAARAERERQIRRPLIRPRVAGTAAPHTETAAAPVADDLSRAITPAMLAELQDSGGWMTGFAVFIGAGAAMVIVGGTLMMFSGIVDGSRLGVAVGVGGGIAQILVGSLELLLFSFVRQHRRAIAAAGDRLTEMKLTAIVDSQRRIWRFFGTVMSFLGGLAVLMFVIGLVSALMRRFL